MDPKQARRTALSVVALITAMGALGFAAAPLYDVFCRVTGFGGTTQRADAPIGEPIDRLIRVRFDTNANKSGLVFKALQYEQEMRVGETGLAFFEATNPSDEPVVAVATFNVTPHKAGPYFLKLECFCYDETVFAPGETRSLPVAYSINTAIDDDRLLDEIREVTLSYTYFPAAGAEQILSEAPGADAPG